MQGKNCFKTDSTFADRINTHRNFSSGQETQALFLFGKFQLKTVAIDETLKPWNWVAEDGTLFLFVFLFRRWKFPARICNISVKSEWFYWISIFRSISLLVTIAPALPSSDCLQPLPRPELKIENNMFKSHKVVTNRMLRNLPCSFKYAMEFILNCSCWDIFVVFKSILCNMVSCKMLPLR